MNQTKLSEYLSNFYAALVRAWKGLDPESKVYLLIFFFFAAAIASIIYKTAIDTYVVDEENSRPYFRMLRTEPPADKETGRF